MRRHVFGNLLTDLHKRLFARVFFGDVDIVGIFSGKLAEVFSALERLAARTAEHRDNASAGKFLGHRIVQALKAELVMRIIDDSHHAVVRIGIAFHASRGTRFHKAYIHKMLRNAEQQAHADGGQCVLHVEQTGNGERKLFGIVRRADGKDGIVSGFMDVIGKNIGFFIGRREGYHLFADACRRKHLVAAQCVKAHAGAFAMGKQLHF